MKYLFLILLFIPAAAHAQSKAQYNQNNAVQEAEAMQQFRDTWFRFADAVLAKDEALLKKMSAACIRCSDCVLKAGDQGNTSPSESSLVPIDNFLSNNLPSIFDAATQARLKNPGKLTFVDDSQNRDLYQAICMGRTDPVSRQKEALLLLVDPSQETGGLQQAFSFMETPEGYKFCGYSTIP